MLQFYNQFQLVISFNFFCLLQICEQNQPFSRSITISKNKCLILQQQVKVRMNARVPPPLTWHIFQIIVDVLSLIMFACVLNQYKCHCLLNDALNYAIFIYWKLKQESIISSSFDNFMEKESIVAHVLDFLVSNMKINKFNVFIIFIFFETV